MNVAPYETLKEKFGVQIDFMPFFLIEPLTSREFRGQRLNILDYTAIVFPLDILSTHSSSFAKNSE